MFKKFIFIFSILMIIAAPVYAGLPSLVPDKCKGGAEECDLEQVEVLLGNVAGVILGVAGSIALLMFVIGGLMYIFSAGVESRVQTATKILTTSVIGLALILGAGVIIKFILQALQAT